MYVHMYETDAEVWGDIDDIHMDGSHLLRV